MNALMRLQTVVLSRPYSAEVLGPKFTVPVAIMSEAESEAA